MLFLTLSYSNVIVIIALILVLIVYLVLSLPIIPAPVIYGGWAALKVSISRLPIGSILFGITL